MKNIPNLTLNTGDEKNPSTTTAKMLASCLDSPPERFFDFATIRARNRVADVLDKVTDGGEIILEDADYEVAKQAIELTRWVKRSKHIIQFADQFGL